MLKKNTAKIVVASAMACLMAATTTAYASSGTIKQAAAKAVTISFFSDLPDRTSGQGLLEQTLINQYEKLHPNVTVKVEALQDTPYKVKFKAYTTSNSLPDVFMAWGQPSFFKAVMQKGYAAKLDSKTYASYNFLKGSLNGFSLNGKLYGLPRNSDYMVLYYNQKILKDNGLSVPKTTADLIADAKKLKSKGIAAVSVGGGDKWPLAYLFNDIVMKETGNDSAIETSLSKKNFSSSVLLKSANYLKTLADDGIFQQSYLTDDTGAAQNLFAQGKAAFLYSGEWDMGMATNTAFSSDFKTNLRVTAFPTIPGGKGKKTDIMAWNGGGYALSAKSHNLTEAKALLNYIMKPTNWSKIGWQKGYVVPAQKFSSFMTGKENIVQKSLVSILNTSTTISGTGMSDCGSSQFKTDSESATQAFCSGQLTAQQFLSTLTASIKK